MPDPVLKRIPREELSDDLKAVWDGSHALAGEATFVEVFANNPDILNWYNDSFYGQVFHGPNSKVDLRTKELLRLRLSKGHGCHVCNSFNVTTAKAAGFSDAQIDGVVEADPALFDARDLAIIDLAAQIEIGNNEGHLSSNLHDRLGKYYDDAQIVELGMIGAILTGMSKLLFVYDLVTREEVCPIRRPQMVAA